MSEQKKPEEHDSLIFILNGNNEAELGELIKKQEEKIISLGLKLDDRKELSYAVVYGVPKDKTVYKGLGTTFAEALSDIKTKCPFEVTSDVVVKYCAILTYTKLTNKEMEEYKTKNKPSSAAPSSRNYKTSPRAF